MSLFPEQRKGEGWWARHSLSVVLVAMLAGQTAHALWAGRHVYVAEQLDVPFWVWWGWEYNVSLVADTFGVLLVVLLTKGLYEENSAESN